MKVAAPHMIMPHAKVEVGRAHSQAIKAPAAAAMMGVLQTLRIQFRTGLSPQVLE